MPFKSPTIALPVPNRKAGTASVPQDKTAYLFMAAVGGPVPCRAERGHGLRRRWPQGRPSSPPERPPALLPADVGIKAIRHAMPVPPPSAQQASHPYLAAAFPPNTEGEAEEQRHPFAEAGGPPFAVPSPPLWTRAAGLLPVFQKIQGYIKGCSLRPYKKQKMPVPKREHGRRAMRAPSAGLPLFAEKPYPWKGRKGADDAFNLFHTTP